MAVRKTLTLLFFPLQRLLFPTSLPKILFTLILSILIDEAKESIYAAFYKIELKKVSHALIKAHQRGIKIKIFTDDLTSQDEDSQVDYLAKFGFIKKDCDPDSFMHHKFCVIDEEIVVIGRQV
jgi:phosphatidylserine/phosphatidylglycerophosphate/cardiolipin synthase-like enzyme